MLVCYKDLHHYNNSCNHYSSLNYWNKRDLGLKQCSPHLLSQNSVSSTEYLDPGSCQGYGAAIYRLLPWYNKTILTLGWIQRFFFLNETTRTRKQKVFVVFFFFSLFLWLFVCGVSLCRFFFFYFKIDNSKVFQSEELSKYHIAYFALMKAGKGPVVRYTSPAEMFI